MGDCTTALALLTPDAGVHVHTMAFSEDLIPRIEGLAPDLILIEVDPEKRAGLELCREIKEHPTATLFPVIAVSRSPRLRLEALASGADDFVTRQVEGEVFRTRVRGLVRSGAARRKLALANEVMRQAFRRYLSPRLADRILSDVELRDSILAASDVRTHAVVLFADMRGFTSISERLSPDEVVPLLNEYFSLLTEITFRHEGTVFHMAGDCLMVGFGVPVEQPDSAERAVRAAREMLDRFGDLAESWRQRYRIETGLGIGINEGEVIAGNVGSPAYMNYTIIGDTVNVAARLSQRARAGEMLFSRSVKRSLDAHGVDIGALELPPLTVRGRSTPIDIFCVPVDRRVELQPIDGVVS